MSLQMSLCTIDFGNQTAPHVLRSCHASTTFFYNNITTFLKITKKTLISEPKITKKKKGKHEMPLEQFV